MNRTEEMACIIDEVAETWMTVYRRLKKADLVKDEPALVSAANGNMIAIERAIGGFRMPHDAQDFKTGKEIADEKKTTPNPSEPPKTQPPKAEPPKEETFMPPAYDEKNKRWDYCPKCHSNDITRVGRSGKEYQSCKNCGIYLNFDGTTPPIPPKGRRT